MLGLSPAAREIARSDDQRYARAHRPHVEYRAMAPTLRDIEELRVVLKWVRANKGPAQSATRERMLADALERAIALLAEPETRCSALGWVLAALRQSVRRSPQSNNTWFIVDRDLYTWAMEQVEKLTSGPEGAN